VNSRKDWKRQVACITKSDRLFVKLSTKNEGTMPENLPTPEKSISEIGKEQLKKLKEKKEPPMLDE